MRPPAILLLLALSTPALSQSCGTSASARTILERLEIPDNEHLPAARREELRLEILRSALSTAPADIALNEAYQATRLAGDETDRAAVIAEYEKVLAKNPQDPVFLYLAANAQIGRNTKEAIANLDRAIELAPDFGLPHLLLARIYSSETHNDPAQMSLHLKRFAALCPASVRTLPTLRWSKDAELMQGEATRLRKNIEARTDSEAVSAYFVLWMLEAARQRSDQQSENQARMRRDIDRLFGPEFVRNSAWLSTISQAETHLDGAPEGIGERARQEVATLYPDSDAACNEEAHKARAGIKYPENGTQEQFASYWSQTWRALLPVVRKCPASPWLAFTTADAAIRDHAASREEVNAAVALFQNSIQQDPMGFRTLPPTSILIVQSLVERGGPFESVPDLVFAGIAETDRGTAAQASDDLTSDSTRTALTRNDDGIYLRGYLPLAEAYIRLGNLSRANDTLLQADLKLDALRPARDASSGDNASFAELSAQYWFVRGLYAETDHRKLDALVDYRNAIGLFPPRRESSDRRDEVMASAERLWKEIGGTTQGWSDWAAQSPLSGFYAGSGATESWSRLAESSPNLVFKDSLGNSWSPRDLAKRTTFVTLWASWCGPCRAELPYVEKLYQQFRGRSDVAILALNVDDDPKAMTQALGELRLSIPSVAARDFAYSIVPEMALPANWIITPKKTEMFEGNDNSLEVWLEEAAAAIEKAAGK
jgi:thiol-disulfide isomerase/thioredoxin